MNVCVIDCGADFPWGRCKCEDFPPHEHMKKRAAQKAVSRGELRFRAKQIYQRVQHEKVGWKVIRGMSGFVGVQMV